MRAAATRRRPPPRLPNLSVEVLRRTRVWSKPGITSLGEVLRGTHLPFAERLQRRARKANCPKHEWYRVGQEAFVCAEHAKPSFEFPHGTPQPVLPAGRLVPRRVFYALRDGVAIFKSRADVEAGRRDRVVEKGFAFEVVHGYIKIKGTPYVLTRRREFVPRSEMGGYRPSEFEGRRLDGRPEKPIGCVYSGKSRAVYDRPGRIGKRVGSVDKHTWVTIHEERKERRERYYRIGENRWVKAKYVRKVAFSDPPSVLRSPDEKWFEVLTGQQTIVAYEGKKPVYAALVSSGRHQDPTPHGLFRVYVKISVAPMNNRPGAAELYTVEAVPWIMYFHKGYALHGAYWHNGFGHPRSHGCINLAPKDARVLFNWSLPRLADGWQSRWSDDRAPGSLLRVRKNVRQKVGPKVTAPH